MRVSVNIKSKKEQQQQAQSTSKQFKIRYDSFKLISKRTAKPTPIAINHLSYLFHPRVVNKSTSRNLVLKSKNNPPHHRTTTHHKNTNVQQHPTNSPNLHSPPPQRHHFQTRHHHNFSHAHLLSQLLCLPFRRRFHPQYDVGQSNETNIKHTTSNAKHQIRSGHAFVPCYFLVLLCHQFHVHGVQSNISIQFFFNYSFELVVCLYNLLHTYKNNQRTYTATNSSRFNVGDYLCIDMVLHGFAT